MVSFDSSSPGYHAVTRLQRTALGFISVLVLMTFVGTNLQALLWQNSDWLVSTILPAVVVDLTNDERADVGAPTLRRSAVLDEAATKKAAHMAKNEYFAHFSPDGVSPWEFFREAGYVYAHAGENLAIHFTDSGEMVDAWMDSPLHKENIVNGQFMEIGVGTAKGTFDGYETVYVVQLFGTPAVPPAPEPEPEPVAPVVVADTPALAEVVATPPPQPAAVSDEPEPSNELSVGQPEVIEEAQPAPAEEVIVDPAETVIITTELISTSSGLAIANFDEPINAANAGATASLATQPSKTLQYMYFSLALFVTLLLLYSMIHEARRLHFMQAAYSLGLLVVMAALWFVNELLVAGAVVA